MKPTAQTDMHAKLLIYLYSLWPLVSCSFRQANTLNHIPGSSRRVVGRSLRAHEALARSTYR